MISYQLSPFHKKKEPIVISKADRAERIFKKQDEKRKEKNHGKELS